MPKKQRVTAEKNPEIDIHSTAAARGFRLKQARSLTGMSVKEFIEKHPGKISFGGWRGWEQAKGGGLTWKAASIAHDVLLKDGVLCSVEWLMNNVGEGPKWLGINIAEATNAPETGKQNQDIYNELMLFRKQHPNALSMIVEDNSMQPFYEIGDHVAGAIATGHDIKKVIGRFCIIKTITGKLLIRKIREKSEKENCYTLECANQNVEKPFEYDVELSTLAPIVWWRKPID